MRVGFDVSQTGPNKAGCGYYADSLIRALVERADGPEWIFYPTFGDLFWDPDWERGTYAHPSYPRKLAPPDFEVSRGFWRRPGAGFEVELGSPDIIHSNNFYCPRGLRKARLVWTLHDLLFVDHPEWTTEANRVGCFDNSFEAALRADFILANSDTSRKRFLNVFPHYPADRTDVARPASRFSGLEPAPKPNSCASLKTGGFWLAVGTLEPRKNLTRLLEVCRSLRQKGVLRRPLVLAGGEGWMMEEFDPLRSGAIHLGYVDDRTLQWLYENCYAFAFPSLAEGFGMPLVEAMSRGAAVVCSNTTSLPEVAGDAALYCDPFDPESIAMIIERLERNPELREKMRRAATERAGRFSWTAAAEVVLKVYNRVLQLPPLRRD